MYILGWIAMIILFLYTAGYAVTLWKDKNKVGSAAVFFISFAILILPFFSILKK